MSTVSKSAIALLLVFTIFSTLVEQSQAQSFLIVATPADSGAGNMRRKNRIQKAKEARRSRPKRFFAGDEVEDAEANELALAEETADLE